MNIFPITLLVLAYSAGVAAAPAIEPLRESEIEHTCGCNFQLPPVNGIGQTFLQWSEGEDAWMRVDGKLVRLAVKTTTSKYKKAGMISISDVEAYTLSSGPIKVKILSAVTQVCKPAKPECESIGYRARIKVKSPQGIRLFNASGSCGC